MFEWIKIKFNRAVLLGVAIVIFLAFMDSMGWLMFKPIGGYSGDTYSQLHNGYMMFFWLFAYALIALVGISYYFLHRQDKSETLAVVLTPLILVWSGFEDLLFYLFRGIPFTGELPWLDSHFFMGFWAKVIGVPHVNVDSLIFSMISGVVILFIILKVLKRARW